jgi:hypothetical protein
MTPDNLFSHFVITRFNIKNRGWIRDNKNLEVNNDEWLKYRVGIFEKFCLPSIINQTNKDFLWLVFFDISPSDFLKGKIRIWEKDCINFRAVYVEDYESFINHEISGALSNYRDGSKKYIITTRFDNDDVFHRDAVRTIQRNFKPVPKAVIDLEKGYCLSLESKLLYKRKYRSNPFISLIEEVGQNRKILSVMHEGHPAWINKVPFIPVRNTPLWIQVIHEKNVSNSVKGSIMISKKALKDFGIDLNFDNYPFYSMKYKVAGNIMYFKHILKMILLFFWRLLPYKLRDFIAVKRSGQGT